MRRLTISLDIAFGKDEPEPAEDVNPQGDVFTNTERRASDEATEAPPIGFGRGPWIDQ